MFVWIVCHELMRESNSSCANSERRFPRVGTVAVLLCSQRRLVRGSWGWPKPAGREHYEARAMGEAAEAVRDASVTSWHLSIMNRSSLRRRCSPGRTSACTCARFLSDRQLRR